MNWRQRIVKYATKYAILGLAVGFVGLSGLCWNGLCWNGSALAVSMPKTSASTRVQTADRAVLDLPLLEARLNVPVQVDGALAVDLSGLVIDLRGETAESATFAEAFYQKLQQRLNEKQPNGKQAIGLNLNNTLIKGEFNLARLSLRVPAYSSVSIPALDAFNTQFGTALSETDAFAFQGSLWLRQACFTGVFQADDLYLLGPVDAEQAIFTQLAHWRTTRFARSANFSQVQFQQESSFRSAVFAGRTRFNDAIFSGASNWQSATFDESAQFSQASFQAANFARSHWYTDAAFGQASFHAPLTFQKSRFDQALFFSEAQFEAAANFRQVGCASTKCGISCDIMPSPRPGG